MPDVVLGETSKPFFLHCGSEVSGFVTLLDLIQESIPGTGHAQIFSNFKSQR